MADPEFIGSPIKPIVDKSTGQTETAAQLKARLSPAILRDYNITFDAKTDPDIDPLWLESLSQAQDQIYFSHPISANTKSSEGEHEQTVARHKRNVLAAGKIVKKAIDLSARENVNEAEYQRLMDIVFQKWEDYTDNAGPNPRKDRTDWLARGEQTYMFAAAYEARAQTRLASTISKVPTRPKPDFWFAFPIDETLEDDEVARHSDLPFKALLELEMKIGLWSCPLMSLRCHKPSYQDDGRLKIDNRLVCYPWLVVEVKKRNDLEAEFCYCQAANGCSVSLAMLEHLTRHRCNRHRPNERYPIISFTLVGVDIKLWLAYTKEMQVTDSWHKSWSSEHHMQCIWEGKMANLLHTIELCRILDTILFWARRHLRPWIASQIKECQSRMEETNCPTKRVESPNVSTPDQINLSGAPITERSPSVPKHAVSPRADLPSESCTGPSARPGDAKEKSTSTSEVCSQYQTKNEDWEPSHSGNYAIASPSLVPDRGQEILQGIAPKPHRDLEFRTPAPPAKRRPRVRLPPSPGKPSTDTPSNAKDRSKPDSVYSSTEFLERNKDKNWSISSIEENFAKSMDLGADFSRPRSARADEEPREGKNSTDPSLFSPPDKLAQGSPSPSSRSYGATHGKGNKCSSSPAERPTLGQKVYYRFGSITHSSHSIRKMEFKFSRSKGSRSDHKSNKSACGGTPTSPDVDLTSYMKWPPKGEIVCDVPSEKGGNLKDPTILEAEFTSEDSGDDPDYEPSDEESDDGPSGEDSDDGPGGEDSDDGPSGEESGRDPSGEETGHDTSRE